MKKRLGPEQIIPLLRQADVALGKGEKVSEVCKQLGISKQTPIVFDLSDEHGQPVNDLEPYLGAMGHLVILSADGKQFVHAHPDAAAEKSNKVKFGAHFPNAGIYKGWGEFQRAGTVHTIPFVIEVN